MSPISNASRLADFGSGIGTQGAVIQVDNTNQRVGIGTTNPQAMLQVGTAISMFGSTGIVSATTFYGSGEGLTGVASTDNIVTGTAATFNNKVFVGTAITMEPGTGGGINVTGVVTATTFYGSGEGLTGVASTDNIITGTAATFNNEVHVGVALTIGYAGVATFSGAGGIGVTITPSTGKVEASEIRANEFYGDGSNLEGISAGLGTALGDSAPLDTIFKTPYILYVGAIGAGVTINVTSDATSGNVAFMRQRDVYVAAGSTMTIGAGTTLIQNVLSIF